jgi:bacterioferritin (cytochrome b1)
MHVLSRHNRDAVIALLGERLESERAAVTLYDAVLGKMRASKEEGARRLLPTMHEHRNEVNEHAEWLAKTIESLGGSVELRNERVDLVRREAAGMVDVVEHDDELSHLLHALLATELLDSAGWDLLVELADEANDIEALRELEHRKSEQEEHLVFLRDALAAIARREVLGDESRIVAQGP